MKLSHMLLSAVLLCAPALAAEVWAPGVSRNGGWVDYNKDSQGGIWEDSGMCWAASASNVISWWQQHNQDKLSANTPTGGDVWMTFRGVFQDDGGYPDQAYDWWINGTKGSHTKVDETIFDYDKEMGTYNDNWTSVVDNKTTYYAHNLHNGGFLKNIYDTTAHPIIYSANAANSYDFARSIVEALQSGYALTISVSDSSKHAYTLWGVEYDYTGEGIVLNKAWITDSDDGKTDLIGASVSFKAEEGAHSISLYNIPSYNNMSFKIDTLAGMWVDPKLVPEPATATLGLLALCGLAARRRRR